jgi:hypothetical protein
VTVDPLTAWLDTAQADADAATPGPWARDGLADVDGSGETLHRVGPHGSGTRVVPDAIVLTDYQRDAVFIAHARTRDPRMVAAIRDVLALHRLDEAGDCATCYPVAFGYPCPTVHALSARLLGDDTPNEEPR